MFHSKKTQQNTCPLCREMCDIKEVGPQFISKTEYRAMCTQLNEPDAAAFYDEIKWNQEQELMTNEKTSEIVRQWCQLYGVCACRKVNHSAWRAKRDFCQNACMPLRYGCQCSKLAREATPEKERKPKRQKPTGGAAVGAAGGAAKAKEND